MSVFLRESTPLSRGKVCCDLCGYTIPAGTRYHSQVSANDGRASTWRECTVCAEAANAWLETADRWDLEDGYGTDTIDEWARDNPDDPRAVAYLALREQAAISREGRSDGA